MNSQLLSDYLQELSTIVWLTIWAVNYSLAITWAFGYSLINSMGSRLLSGKRNELSTTLWFTTQALHFSPANAKASSCSLANHMGSWPSDPELYWLMAIGSQTEGFREGTKQCAEIFTSLCNIVTALGACWTDKNVTDFSATVML